MKNPFHLAFSWGKSPLDIRLGAMFGIDHTYLVPEEGKTESPECIMVHLVVGLLWVNIHGSVTIS